MGTKPKRAKSSAKCGASVSTARAKPIELSRHAPEYARRNPTPTKKSFASFAKNHSLFVVLHVCNTFCKFSACTTQNEICSLLVTLKHDFRKLNRNNSNHLFYNGLDVCSSFCKFSGCATHGELRPLSKTQFWKTCLDRLKSIMSYSKTRFSQN